MNERTGATTLRVAAVGSVDASLLAWLCEQLATVFRALRCTRSRPFAPRDDWRRPDATGCDADTVLDALLDWHAARVHDPTRVWLLGVTDLELTDTGGSPVFGQATVGGCCAVVSTAQFRPAGAARGEQLALLRLRLLKEAVHELGHVAGLGHCDRPSCVMFPSTTVDATDARPSDFCSACARLLPPRLRPPG